MLHVCALYNKLHVHIHVSLNCRSAPFYLMLFLKSTDKVHQLIKNNNIVSIHELQYLLCLHVYYFILIRLFWQSAY